MKALRTRKVVRPYSAIEIRGQLYLPPAKTVDLAAAFLTWTLATGKQKKDQAAAKKSPRRQQLTRACGLVSIYTSTRGSHSTTRLAFIKWR